MSKELFLKNGTIVNENREFLGSIHVKEGFIHEIIEGDAKDIPHGIEVIDITGKQVIPGVIDDQVHFREPGLTHKADIGTESRAAIAGGVTSFMEMPNTKPQTDSQKLLNEKFEIASKKSCSNYSFFLGATNNNLNEILKIDPLKTCGIKVFMGSSTGNMLVDSPRALEEIFRNANVPVAVHCEDEGIIKANTEKYKSLYGEFIPMESHMHIRNEEACYKSSSTAVELANKYSTRLHVLHISTAKELELFTNKIPSSEKKITSEVCIHHLFFTQKDYSKLGSRIKWNPSIKKESDKDALMAGLLSDKVDVIASDHAPHTIEEKENPYLSCPSGGPLVQHTLPAMLEFYHSGQITLGKIVNKMCHTPADIFQVNHRGYIKKGFYADLVVLDLDNPWEVSKENILYKCKWSPFEGYRFRSKIIYTLVNGNIVYDHGIIHDGIKGMPLTFNR
ncbi:MAG: dihydroorotase [bacterium]